jgi:hypothetical protein
VGIGSLLALTVLVTGVYVVRAQQERPRIFQFAVATVEPGGIAEYLNTVEQRIMPLFEEQGADVIGVFRNQIGGPSNQVIFLVGYRDLAHLQSFSESAALTGIQEGTFESMRVLESHTLAPVPFSPLR